MTLKNKSRLLICVFAVIYCMTALSVSAFAAANEYYASDEESIGTPTPADAIDNLTVSTEPVATPESESSEPIIRWDTNATEIGELDEILSDFLAMMGGTALTPEGNMTLVDDILQDESYYVQDEKVVQSKQFITVQSKNGNVFYIIIDRSGNEENVYFLNLVDEADLLQLMENGGSSEPPVACTCADKCKAGEVNSDCPVCKNNMSECAGKEPVNTTPEEPLDEPTPTTEPKEEKSSNQNIILLVVLVLACAGGGAIWYFKFRKPKPDTKGDVDLDDYNYGEDEDYDTEEIPEEEIADEDDDQ